jgi:hypothetical protein
MEKHLEALELMAADLIHAAQIEDTAWVRNIAHLLEMELYEIRAEQVRQAEKQNGAA